ncbi:MAG TPA: hypothetical protein VHA56_19565 [Mucilaginibacter sp.]|nr:hypothetical protein [Mucilaginibacter sp.]
MKSLLTLSFLILTYHLSSAQSNYFEYNGKNDFGSFLKMKIRPVPVIMENCLMPFTYIKFKVNNQNSIDSLTITNNSIPEVTNEITRVMSLTNGHWNSELIKDKWLIVPLIFYTEFNDTFIGKGCDFKKILAEQNKEMDYKIEDVNAMYFPIVKINSTWH